MMFITADDFNFSIKFTSEELERINRQIDDQRIAAGGEWVWDCSVHPPIRYWQSCVEPAEPRRPQ